MKIRDSIRRFERVKNKSEKNVVMKYRSRWVAAAVSLFLLIGTGQLYNGQAIKGIVFFILTWGFLFLIYYLGIATTFYGFIGAFCFCVFLYLFIIIDAICNAGREISLHWYNRWYLYLLPIVVVFVVIVVLDVSGIDTSNLNTFGVRSYYMPASSMEPTLLRGDRIIVDLRPLARKSINRGDLIVFEYPEDLEKDFIKRVIGLPGDKIKVDGKDVYLNGKKLEYLPVNVHEERDNKRRETETILPWGDTIKEIFKERLGLVEYLVQFDRDYTQRSMGHFMAEHGGEVTVPEEQLFVMGDYRDNSNDSREWGYVPAANLKGKALFIFWSSDHDRIGKDFK